MTKKANTPQRLKQDGSTDTMCLSCFETFSPAPVGLASSQDVEQDHVCSFAFPDRRSNIITFENGPKRRKSDMDWQALVSREALLPAE